MQLEQLARDVITAWESGDPAHAIGSLEAYLQRVDAERSAHDLTIEAARSNYTWNADNDIEIDDTPLLSIADEGVWVSAWVWVPIDDADDGQEAAA